MTFRTLLIANRGEIAVRIARTARRLGIRTVAVFSDADRCAAHVDACDDAYALDRHESPLCYLDPAAIAGAALNTGAEAIHPGYGFLSESPQLAEACREAGLLFVGPSVAALRAMGSKIEAKRLAREAGVPVVPGYADDDQSAERLRRESERIGYPLLIKASAGGGGKGMRPVTVPGDFDRALATVQREALAAFGDGRVLLERLIAKPRHIEVQLLGDKHGNLIHLFERDCSIQRHHQKVIEEAPAPDLPQPLREGLFDSALRLGNVIAYDSAGTVEFIVDGDTNDYYFLEMNTRLQVEHPVTELITGLDLVELQLRSAAGFPLGLRQSDIVSRGCAIEARICAEDPAHDYAAQIGSVEIYHEPDDTVRIDSGIRKGSVVTPYYDSMLAKAIAYGATRTEAAQRLADGLAGFALAGVDTNIAFLRDVLLSARFADPPHSTHFIEAAFPGGWRPGRSERGWDAAAAAAVSIAALERTRRAADPIDPWNTLGRFRCATDGADRDGTKVRLRRGTEPPEEVTITGRAGSYRIPWDDGDALVTVDDEAHVSVYYNRRAKRYECSGEDGHVALAARGSNALYHIEDPMSPLGAAATSSYARPELRAPMPGLVAQVHVGPGDAVRAGESIVVLEAMKLIHDLRADVDGIVSSVHCRVGDTVAGGALLAAFERPNEPA